jgi:hypothetical protein
MPAFLGDPAASKGGVPVRVLALPAAARESSRDWHGLALEEALERLVRRGSIRMVRPSSAGPFALGSVFWRAFLRGSIQAGVYVVDSLAAGTGVLHR